MTKMKQISISVVIDFEEKLHIVFYGRDYFVLKRNLPFHHRNTTYRAHIQKSIKRLNIPTQAHIQLIHIILIKNIHNQSFFEININILAS